MKLHAAPMAPEDAPSMMAMKLMGAQLQGIQLQQHDHGRHRGPTAPRPGRARLLRRDHPQAAAGSRAHPAHPGLLGRYVNGGRRAERRRQSLLRDAEPRRRAGPDPGQRRRSGRPQGHRGHQSAAGRAGLRRRSGGAHRRSARHRQRQPGTDHPVHPPRDRGHVAGRLPLDQNHADPALPDVPRTADRARGGLGACQPWRVRADDVRREHPDDAGDRGRHRLRHLHLRPLSRSARHGSGSG